MRVLAVGSHPDDVELGCGASLARHVLDGDDAMILTLATGIMSRLGSSEEEAAELHRHAREAAQAIGADLRIIGYPDQRLDTVGMLELVRTVEETVGAFRPALVYTHHREDRNLDHRLTHEAVLTACRPMPGGSVRAVRTFEVPSSTEWGREFWPTVFVNVEGEPWTIKESALACYAGEMRKSPHPRSMEAIRCLAQWRGATAGLVMAEAFELVRDIR